VYKGWGNLCALCKPPSSSPHARGGSTVAPPQRRRVRFRLELYVWRRCLFLVVEFPPDVPVFAAVRGMTGQWSVLAPVNRHPGGGVGVCCVGVIAKRDCRFSLEPRPRRTRDRRRLPVVKR